MIGITIMIVTRMSRLKRSELHFRSCCILSCVVMFVVVLNWQRQRVPFQNWRSHYAYEQLVTRPEDVKQYHAKHRLEPGGISKKNRSCTANNITVAQRD